MLLTGLTIGQLLVKAHPAPQDAPPAAVEDKAPPTEAEFLPTPSRVQIALQHGLKFGPERAAFCATHPQGDLDKLWRDWCASRSKAPQPIGAPVPAAQASAPQLYDHLAGQSPRPDFRPDPDIIATGETSAGRFGIRLGGAKSD